MPEPRVVAVIQARMTSTRLPGKVLAEVGGRPMLEQQLRRLARTRSIDEFVIATTENATDDPICALATRLFVRCHRGSEDDVLSRVLEAAKGARAEVVVRVTADCPLLDPSIIDDVVGAMVADPSCDYASNVLERSYPRGLDVEAVRMDALERVATVATSQEAREHVTWHIVREDPTSFSTRSIRGRDDNSDLRWTVDTEDDLDLVRQIYDGLQLDAHHKDYAEILAWVRARPELQHLNQHVLQKHG